MQRIIGPMRKAIEHYAMIEEGDKIAVGLSGGKDSITLLKGLKTIQRFYPKKFDLIAISINPGFDSFDAAFLEKTCEEIGVPLFIEKTDIKEIVFDIRKEKNPCSLCANLRRGVLNSTANREHCNKLALGHNEDDVLETFFLNLLYAGNLSTFAPISYMDRSGITLIRPMVYLSEKEIRAFVKRSQIQVMPKCCPMDGKSKREDFKLLLKDLTLRIPSLRANLMGAIKRSHINGWKEEN